MFKLGSEGTDRYPGSPLGGRAGSEARSSAPEEAAPTELLAHVFAQESLLCHVHAVPKNSIRRIQRLSLVKRYFRRLTSDF